jgi:two-component system OmpR family response regulator
VRVLLVEDKPKLAAVIGRGLRKAGLSTDLAGTGEEAIWMAASVPYEAVVLDVMLPGIDGFETCRRLRSRQIWAPVLMLTARDGIEDRVAGLDSGADDYLTKPFALSELLARLRALARRGNHERPAELHVGELRLDPASSRLWRGEQEISVSRKEFSLLEALMRRQGDVLSRLDLLEAAWDQSYENRSNIVDAYVHRLRARIDKPFGTRSLETVRGAGYRIRSEQT